MKKLRKLHLRKHDSAPEEIEKYTDSQTHELFPIACNIIGLVRKAKSENGLSLNSPLEKIIIFGVP